MKARWKILTSVAALSLIAAAAETVMVNSAEVTIREKDRAISSMVTTAPKGSTLTVLETKGLFKRVSYNGKEGWVRTADLEATASTVNLKGTSGLSGGSGAGSVRESAAGKGLGSGTIQYGKASGSDPAKLQHLIDLRKRIVDSGEWSKFAAEGKVGAR